MKRQLFFAATLLVAVISFSSFSGDKCKYDYEKEDKFSGGVKKYSTCYLVQDDKCTVEIGSSAGKNYFKLHHNVSGESDEVLSTTDTIQLRLEDGNMVSLVPRTNVKAVSKILVNYIVSYWEPVCNISKGKLKKLSESQIVAVKITIAGKEDIIEVKLKRHAKHLMETAACLLADLGE
jgi:hypothetical protein